jgi:xanthine dehydrogenase YagS FAD-binding subunit
MRIIGPSAGEEHILPLENLYRVPQHEGQRENTLLPNQVLTHILLPPDDGRLSAAYEVRHGAGPDQPLAAAAVTIDMVGDIVHEARIVLGQVAPVPWLSHEAARSLAGQPLTESNAEVAGIEALAAAMPLSCNQYKVQLAQVAVKRAILLAAGLDTGGF